MRHWREREFERHLSPAPLRYGLGVWAFFATRPRLYRFATDLAARALAWSAGAAAGSPRCRSPAAGRAIAISRRPRAATFQSQLAGEAGGPMSSRAAIFANIRRSLHVTATRRRASSPSICVSSRRRRESSRSADRATSRPGLRPSNLRRSARKRRHGGREWADARRRSPVTCAKAIAGDACAWAPTRALRRCLDRDHARMSCAALRRTTTSTPSRPPSPESPRPARWRSSPARTIRPRSISCPTTTSSCCRARRSWPITKACSPSCGRYGKGEAPRTLNFITGPSRSADIEQTLLLGAHGPRRLHIVVVG